MECAISPLIRDTPSGACWTCQEYLRACDASLPRCRTCAKHGLTCSGYGNKLSLANEGLTSTRQGRKHRKSTLMRKTFTAQETPSSMPSLALPAEQSYFVQHFSHNIARIGLAIDHHGNGYRWLLPMAMSEPALLNAALAVAASHHSRWQQKTDDVSQKYLRASCKDLKQRFTNPKLTHSTVTLATMLLLSTYEVFLGSDRWKGHLQAIHGWIRSRGDCSDLDPFLKDWVCMLEVQASLSLGTATIPDLDPWMEASVDRKETIDALFGCSVRLPKLMAVASRLLAASKNGELVPSEVQSQADSLQDQIRATCIPQDAVPMLGLACHHKSRAFSNTSGLSEDELRHRATATAEIFRHATHIFVYRITHRPEIPLCSEMQESLYSALELLTHVPDAIGPGANLGWCLVVLGTELEAVDFRRYITSRWAGLHLLGVHNTKNGEKILNEVWNHRDLMKRGYPMASERWQDTMLRIGQAQILI
ncbi:unnamed protein product [Clonostachys rosea]|uniref:Zn(2)-C6 fungal-type domain-containing protein n=1 Tax=Bionectria ochroleuca TaxID=29856 RepID=A0ABY6TXC8_BIOOC|nr:unnamed protein product [Clonostachys rosea]